MQPYFFPYIGYFQLMQAADIFVFHDDVQYIKGGWVNRNRILKDNRVEWLTMPVQNASNYLPIDERCFANEPTTVDKMKRRLAAAYAKVPAFDRVASTIFELLDFPDANVAAFNCTSLVALAKRLGITCKFIRSSELDEPGLMKGQAKVLALCQRFGANTYINPIGGVELYDAQSFAAAGITLSFLRTTAPPTLTESGPEHLSVIDGLMRRDFDGYRSLLPEYSLLNQEDARKQA